MFYCAESTFRVRNTVGGRNVLKKRKSWPLRFVRGFCILLFKPRLCRQQNKGTWWWKSRNGGRTTLMEGPPQPYPNHNPRWNPNSVESKIQHRRELGVGKSEPAVSEVGFEPCRWSGGVDGRNPHNRSKRRECKWSRLWQA